MNLTGAFNSNVDFGKNTIYQITDDGNYTLSIDPISINGVIRQRYYNPQLSYFFVERDFVDGSSVASIKSYATQFTPSTTNGWDQYFLGNYEDQGINYSAIYKVNLISDATPGYWPPVRVAEPLAVFGASETTVQRISAVNSSVHIDDTELIIKESLATNNPGAFYVIAEQGGKDVFAEINSLGLVSILFETSDSARELSNLRLDTKGNPYFSESFESRISILKTINASSNSFQIIGATDKKDGAKIAVSDIGEAYVAYLDPLKQFVIIENLNSGNPRTERIAIPESSSPTDNYKLSLNVDPAGRLLMGINNHLFTVDRSGASEEIFNSQQFTSSLRPINDVMAQTRSSAAVGGTEIHTSNLEVSIDNTGLYSLAYGIAEWQGQTVISNHPNIYQVQGYSLLDGYGDNLIVDKIGVDIIPNKGNDIYLMQSSSTLHLGNLDAGVKASSLGEGLKIESGGGDVSYAYGGGKIVGGSVNDVFILKNSLFKILSSAGLDSYFVAPTDGAARVEISYINNPNAIFYDSNTGLVDKAFGRPPEIGSQPESDLIKTKKSGLQIQGSQFSDIFDVSKNAASVKMSHGEDVVVGGGSLFKKDQNGFYSTQGIVGSDRGLFHQGNGILRGPITFVTAYKFDSRMSVVSDPSSEILNSFAPSTNFVTMPQGGSYVGSYNDFTKVQDIVSSYRDDYDFSRETSVLRVQSSGFDGLVGDGLTYAFGFKAYTASSETAVVDFGRLTGANYVDFSNALSNSSVNGNGQTILSYKQSSVANYYYIYERDSSSVNLTSNNIIGTAVHVAGGIKVLEGTKFNDSFSLFANARGATLNGGEGFDTLDIDGNAREFTLVPTDQTNTFDLLQNGVFRLSLTNIESVKAGGVLVNPLGVIQTTAIIGDQPSYLPVYSSVSYGTEFNDRIVASQVNSQVSNIQIHDNPGFGNLNLSAPQTIYAGKGNDSVTLGTGKSIVDGGGLYFSDGYAGGSESNRLDFSSLQFSSPSGALDINQFKLNSNEGKASFLFRNKWYELSDFKNFSTYWLNDKNSNWSIFKDVNLGRNDDVIAGSENSAEFYRLGGGTNSLVLASGTRTETLGVDYSWSDAGVAVYFNGYLGKATAAGLSDDLNGVNHIAGTAKSDGITMRGFVSRTDKFNSNVVSTMGSDENGLDTVAGNGSTILDFDFVSGNLDASYNGIVLDLSQGSINLNAFYRSFKTNATNDYSRYWDAARESRGSGSVNYSGIGGAFGTSLNDIFYGSSTENNYESQTNKISGYSLFVDNTLREVFMPRGGDDFVDGRAGLDFLKFQRDPNDAPEGVSINLKDGISIASRLSIDGAISTFGTDSFRSIEAVTGSDQADVFDARGFGSNGATNIGSYGKLNYFEGLGGDDTVLGNGSTGIGYFSSPFAVEVDLKLGFSDALNEADKASPFYAALGRDQLSGISFVSGSKYNDKLTGATLDEEFYGNAGNDLITGNEGIDSSFYTGRKQDYQISSNKDGSLSVRDLRADSPDGTDTLMSVEKLVFTDQTYEVPANRQVTGIAYDWFNKALLQDVTVRYAESNSLPVNQAVSLKQTQFIDRNTIQIQVIANPSSRGELVNSVQLDLSMISGAEVSFVPESNPNFDSWIFDFNRVQMSGSPESVEYLLSGYNASGIDDYALKDSSSYVIGTLTLKVSDASVIKDIQVLAAELTNTQSGNFSYAMGQVDANAEGRYNLGWLDSRIGVSASMVDDAGNPLNVGKSSVVTAKDAYLAAMIASGRKPTELSDAEMPYALMAADVTRDGKVTIADVYMISRMAAKKTVAIPYDWYFIREGAESYASFTLGTNSNKYTNAIDYKGIADYSMVGGDASTAVNLVGILKGDIDHSWRPLDELGRPITDGSFDKRLYLESKQKVIDFSQLGPELIPTLTSTDMKAFSVSQIASLIDVQLQSFTTSQLSVLSTSQFKALTNEQMGWLTSTQLISLSSTQLTSMSTVQVSGLAADSIDVLSTRQVSWLSSTQMGVLTTVQIAGLSSIQVASLSTTQVRGLTTAQIQAIEMEDVSSLSSRQLAVLSTAQLKAFTEDQMLMMSSQQSAALTSTQLAAFVSPIVLALDSAEIQTLSMDAGVQFDVANVGEKYRTGWVGSGSGLLVRDVNHDGQINDGGELFGEGTLLISGGKASDGYQALSELDTNRDGFITSADEKYGELKLWQDVNANGITDGGELKSLSELGISSLSLSAEKTAQLSNGNLIGLMGSYTKQDGSTHAMADIWFKVDRVSTANPVRQIAPPDMSHILFDSQDLFAGDAVGESEEMTADAGLAEHSLSSEVGAHMKWHDDLHHWTVNQII